jgi:hypothetical protein
MPNIEILSTIPPAMMSELQERAELAARGVIDSQARQTARARMDRMREGFCRRRGELNLAVELSRELRDGK